MVEDSKNPDLKRRRKNQIEEALGAWRLSQIVHGDMKSTTSSVSFSHLSLVAQMKKNDDEVWSSLARSHGIDAENPGHLLTDRLMRMRNWIGGDQFPDSSRVVINESIEKSWIDSLESEQKGFIKCLNDNIPQEFDEESTRHWVNQASSESELPGREAYRILYRIILGKDKGPRIASLLSTMDTEEITNLLSTAI